MGTYLMTSESVTNGHPDKVADQVSDSVLDAALAQDPGSRVACETLLARQLCVVAGEVRTTADIDYEAVARKTILDIGYDSPELGFDARTADFVVRISGQSSNITVGVDTAEEVRADPSAADTLDLQGAGDQGLMYGYACNETPTLMPMAIHLAHRMAERLAETRVNGVLSYLRPDGKTQVTVEYDGGRPVAVRAVLISAQHAPGVDRDGRIRPDLLELVARPVLAGCGLELANDAFMVNPTGTFEQGGPGADAGLTGRKIIVDSYGGAARHGGGAFSGKDPSKVDRSAAYAARWVAKNVVASGAADRCEVQVAYAIGRARPVSVMVETFSTEHVDPGRIGAAVSDIFDLRPAAIVRDLDLLRPVYAGTAAFGHFGREGADFTWERTDRADALAKALGL